MDQEAAKEALRQALEIAMDGAMESKDHRVIDHLWDMIYYLGWGKDFGAEEEEEEAA